MVEQGKCAPRVSVALASYNGKQFIEEQLDSILAQLTCDDELVVSDDGSSDGAWELILRRSGADSRIRPVRNSHLGVVGNFNSALSRCVGDVVFISDQDDVWLPGKRQAMVEALEESGADLVIHRWNRVDRSGAPVGGASQPGDDFELGFFRNLIASRYSGCCMALDRRALRYVLPLPKTVLNYDRWIGLACEAFGGVYKLDDVLLDHRIHDSNATPKGRGVFERLKERAAILWELAKRRGCA